VPTTTLTAAVVTILRNNRTNQTATTTSFVDLRLPYSPPAKLHDGTVVSALKIDGPTGVFETTL